MKREPAGQSGVTWRGNRGLSKFWRGHRGLSSFRGRICFGFFRHRPLRLRGLHGPVLLSFGPGCRARRSRSIGSVEWSIEQPQSLKSLYQQETPGRERPRTATAAAQIIVSETSPQAGIAWVKILDLPEERAEALIGVAMNLGSMRSEIDEETLNEIHTLSQSLSRSQLMRLRSRLDLIEGSQVTPTSRYLPSNRDGRVGTRISR